MRSSKIKHSVRRETISPAGEHSSAFAYVRGQAKIDIESQKGDDHKKWLDRMKGKEGELCHHD